MASSCSRSVQEADAVAEKAKLELPGLLPRVQTLVFDQDCNTVSSKLTLVEADAHVLQHLSSGASLVVRGDPADAAVLCTDCRTYEVREAETSNSLLLLPSLSWPSDIAADQPRHVAARQVAGTFFTYLELRECRPRLRRLRQLLSADPYRGRLQPGSGRSLQQLTDSVQASPQQLTEALRQCAAVLIDGEYHCLEQEYEFQVFSLIAQFVEENSWTLETVQRNLTVTTLSELEPRPVVEACFDRYLQPSGVARADTGEQFYCLREEAVSRLFAELLLRPLQTFNLADFLSSWRQSVPEGVTTRREQLRGLAIVNSEASPEMVVRLSPLDLPEETPARFSALFEIKQLWTADELAPYVEDLTSPSLKLGSLLAKHTRLSTRSGVKMHGPKHAR